MVFFWIAVATAISLIAGLRLGYSARETQPHINAARGLGASEWRIFWRIGLPLSVRPILSSAVLVALGMLTGLAAAFLWRIAP